MTLYKRPTPLQGQDGLRNWLVMFSDNLLQHLTADDKEQVYATCEELLKPTCFHHDEWVIDYYRLRFIARKNSSKRLLACPSNLFSMLRRGSNITITPIKHIPAPIKSSNRAFAINAPPHKMDSTMNTPP